MTSTSPRNLQHKRILITDLENEFGKDLYSTLKSEEASCLIFTFVPDLSRLQSILSKFPDVVPLILDLQGKDGVDLGVKLLSSLPQLDHIINLSGDAGLDAVSRAFTNWKIQDFGENKVKPLISKMKDAGPNKNLIFHSSLGNDNLVSKLKANFDPRFTDSTTAQISTSVRKNFKKWFATSGTSEETSNSSTTTGSVTTSNARATEFAQLAASLSQSVRVGGDRSTSTGSGPSSRSETPIPQQKSATLPPPATSGGSSSSKNLSLPQQNLKILQTFKKRNTKTLKKWNLLLKDVEKQQLSKLKKLDKDLKQMRKKERAFLMSQNAQSNLETVARSNVLSNDTANRILASREARVDKEVDKKVETRRDEETKKIAEDKGTTMDTMVEKLYVKTVHKQIKEFNELRMKYQVC